MNRDSGIRAYVSAIVLTSIGVGMVAWVGRIPFPGVWPMVVLLVVAFLLQISATDSRGGDAEGSLSFIVHLSGGILFGAFWGGLVAAISTASSQGFARRQFIKAVFNVAQRTLSLTAAVITYRLLGGSLPPSYLIPGAAVSPPQI